MKRRAGIVIAVVLGCLVGLVPNVQAGPVPTVTTTLIWSTDCARATVSVMWSHVHHVTGATYKLEESDGSGGFTETASYTEDPFAQRVHGASGWSFYASASPYTGSYEGHTIRAFAELWAKSGGYIGRSDVSQCTPTAT
jgi:hypothetical protein